jgi:hypothetical protein
LLRRRIVPTHEGAASQFRTDVTPVSDAGNQPKQTPSWKCVLKLATLGKGKARLRVTLTLSPFPV